MFKDKYQGKFATAYYSIGSNPLANWDIQCKEGEFRIVQDDIIKSNVLQILSQNVTACSITTPMDPKGSLGIRLPYITLLVKNLGRHFTFEVTILDNENFRRRLRASNYQSATRVGTYMCTMPLCMSQDGWCQVQFNLSQFTERVFNTTYVETVRVQVHANCRLRRVYFSDQLYTDQQLPNEYRLHGIKTVREKPKSMLKKKVSGRKSD